jgi:hypothetical protein
MQPHRCRDNAEGKTGKASDKGRGERPDSKQTEIKCLKSVHGVPHT